MKIYETFFRCPKCSHPYFRKNTYVTLNKQAFKSNPPKAEEEKVIIDYICMNCSEIILTKD